MSEDLGKQVELQAQLNQLLQDRIKLQQKLNYEFDYFFGKLIFIYELNKLYLEKQNA